jgi:uroporphyrinogen-III synthase
MSTSAPPPLRGRAVLVTRPVQQADALAGLIRDAGGDPVLFPALAIEPPTDLVKVRAVLADLPSVDLAIFVSPIAAERTFALLKAAWPAEVAVAAVGEGTASVLRRHVLGPRAGGVIVPAEGADSEALLASRELQEVRGKRVLICRGEGGRDLLAEELRRRGAQVSYAEPYRRVRPATDPSELIDRWERGGLHAVTALSGETLDNLWAMLGARGQQLLRRTPLFVPHPNIAERAARLGLTELAITPPGEAGIVRGLSAWFSLQAR